MKFLLTFDMEEHDEGVEKSSLGSEKLLDFLKKNNIKSTLFFTKFFAENSKGILKECAIQGHEIALHGYLHSDNYRDFGRAMLKKRLSSAKRSVEKISGKKAVGFRAPRMQRVDLDLLKEIGFAYDSSLHPTVTHRYFNLFKKRQITLKPIMEIPVSVTPFLRLPFSWFWFKNLGIRYAKFCTRRCMRDDYVLIYFHPWEFFGKKGKRLASMLQEYVVWCKKQGFEFATVRDYLAGKNSASQRVMEHFDAIAEKYDAFKMGPLAKPLVLSEKRVIERLIPKHKKVLDLGSGSGFYSEILRENGNDVTCMDISEDMCDVTRKKGFKTIRGDMEKIGLNEKFDAILCIGAFEFLKEPEKSVLLMKRHLKKKGAIMISLPKKNLPGLFYRMYYLLKGIRIRLFSRKDISRLFGAEVKIISAGVLSRLLIL